MKNIIKREGREGTTTEFVEFEIENQIAFIAQGGAGYFWTVYQDGRGNSEYGLSIVESFQPNEKDKAVALAEHMAVKSA